MESQSYLKKAQIAFSQDQFDKVKSLILKYAHLTGQGYEEYYQWAKLAEAIGLYEEAITLYNKALKLAHENPQILFALAEIYYLTKDYYKSFKILRNLLKISYEQEICELFIKVVKKLKFEGILKNWRYKKQSPRELFVENILNYNLFSVFDHFKYLFRDIPNFGEVFLDLYGNITLKTDLKKLTINKFKEHLIGRSFLVYFPIKEDLKFSQFFLGIKLSENLLHKYINSESLALSKAEELKNRAQEIFKTLLNWGFPVYLEKFHKFYYRLWFFLEKEISLSLIRKFLRLLIQKLPTLPGGLIWIEGIPQFSANDRFNLKYFPLPLGLYPLTLERSCFLDEYGKAMEDQLKFLKTIQPFPSKLISDFISNVSVKPINFSKISKNLEILVNKCHLINYVIKKAEAGKILSREEKLAIILTVGFLPEGTSLVHKILSQTPDYSYTKIKNLLKNLPSNPISCLKLEVWLKEISALEPCHCLFGKKLKNKYPSPLLHVDSSLVPSYNEISFKINKIEGICQKYLKQYEKLKYLETLLKSYFKEKNISQIKIKNYQINFKDDKLWITKL